MPSSLGRTAHPSPGSNSLPLRGLPGCEPRKAFLFGFRVRQLGFLDGAVKIMSEALELKETGAAEAAQSGPGPVSSRLHCLDAPEAGRPGNAAGLHGRQSQPGGLPAGRADDPRDGDGVGLRGARRVLRRAAGGRRGGGCRAHGVALDRDVRGGDWAVDVRHRARGAAHRREAAGGGRAHGGAGDRCRLRGVGAVRARGFLDATADAASWARPPP